MDESHRKIGIKALKKILKVEKNIELIEKYVHALSMSGDIDEASTIYKTIIFQVVDEILKGTELKTVLSDLKENKFIWNHDKFKDITNKTKEQDEFLLNPFEVEEGVLECYCGSKRVFSYSKQTRGSDEKTTIFAQCVSCKKKWKE